MNDSPKPRRRWFRFSLRTMFVAVSLVGLALGWVVYQLNWIQERHAMLGNLHSGKIPVRFWQNSDFTPLTYDSRSYDIVEAPWSLRLFGEKFGFKMMELNLPKSDPQVTRIRELFPESHVTVAEHH